MDRAHGNARRRATRLPHDAVRASMVASILHLDERTRSQRRGVASPICRRRHGEHVSRNAVLVTVREDRVDSGVRAGVCVDAAAREHQVRIGVETPQPANPLARGGIRLRGDRARVEHANVCRLALRNDVASTRGEPAREVRHLGVVHLAPEHGERDAKRAIDRCAHAGGGAATALRSPAPGEEQRCGHRARRAGSARCAIRGGR